MSSVTAVVAAYNEEPSIADTVRALLDLSHVDSVTVVDDGSSDETASIATSAGADVIRLDQNVGKGGAIAEALGRLSADILLLVDGDVGQSASEAGKLLLPVVEGDADMTIGVFPPSPGKGGLGMAKGLSGWASERMGGVRLKEPLSGQRALSAAVLADLRLDPGYGLETGMNIDALRAGRRVVEVDVKMSHAHTGRDLAGFLHRGRQLLHIMLAVARRMRRSR